MKERKRIKIKLNAPLRGISAGMVVPIQVDENGNPLDKYWRDRLEDSAIDGCVEIIKETKTSKARVNKAETKKKGD